MKSVKEIFEYRNMIAGLVRRELRGRYKGSVLGFLWTFLNPLLQLVVYTIVFGYILKNDIDKYYLYLFVALVPWLFFSSCLTSGPRTILNQKDLVKKIYFPREVLPISFVTTNFINMLLTFIVIFFVVFFSGVRPTAKGLMILPLLFIIEYILALGVTFLSSSITVYLRDLEYFLGIISMAWMYMTPIVYDISRVPERIRGLFYLNPMTPIIIAYRDILYYGHTPELKTLILATITSIFVLLIGWIVFQNLKRHFAEEL